MRFFTYTKYFFYLAFNWNLKIAWHIIFKEINGEKKYGINTTGADELLALDKVFRGSEMSCAEMAEKLRRWEEDNRKK